MKKKLSRRLSKTSDMFLAIFVFLGLLTPTVAASGDPQWRNQTQEKQLVEKGGQNTLKAQGIDAINLTEAILSTNETGTFENKTQNYSSPKSLSSQDSWRWSNFSWQNKSVSGETVSWRIYYGDQDSNFTATNTTSFKVASTKLEQAVFSSKTSGTTFSIFNKSGSLLETSKNSIDRKLASDQVYDVKINQSTYIGEQWTRIRGLNLTSPLNISSQLSVNYTGKEPSLTDIKTPVYAQDDIGLEKNTTTVRLPKNDSVNSILHCRDWNFTQSSCKDWQVNSTSDYSFESTRDYIRFNVSQFDAYGAGQTGPLPNVTEIKIYDVTGQDDKTSGGNLVAEGLNQSFNISQKQQKRTYRFNFTIKNDGLENWSINSSDELYHSGLSKNWSVGQIWYNLPSGNFTGGSFESGQVSWDTSLGGTLDYNNANDSMYASYVVNISQNSSKAFDQRFEVNDTSENAGSFDEHIFDVKKYGFLDVNLTEPPQDTTVQKDSFFVMNATVECIEGECGKVSVSPRYNESTVADTIIPESSSRPFYVSGANTVACNTNDSLKEACSYSWEVNASGPLDSEHLLDVNASSSFGQVQGNDSKDNRVRIDNAVRINVTWNTINFGVLDPGDTEQPAENNSEGYNVTVLEDSLDVDDLWVRAENMTTDGWKNPSTDESYVIPAKNILYSLNSFVDTKEPLTNNYQHVISDLNSGSTITTHYWMNVPEGIKSSQYNGSIYFKANATN